MAVSYVTLYLPDGTPVQVVEGGPLHKLYVARGADGAPPTPGPVVRLDPFPQYVDQDELTQALGGVAASDTAVAALVNDTGSQTRGALGAAFGSLLVKPSGDTTGAADVAAINGALAGAYKQVRLLPGGVYYCNAPIYLTSGSVFDATGAEISLVDGVLINLLRNTAVLPTRTTTDAASTSGSTTVTSATAAFTAADIGKPVGVARAADAGQTWYGRIVSVTSATQAVLDTSANVTLTNAELMIFGSRDKNITVRGGSWRTPDLTGLGAKNAATTAFNSFCSVFRRIDGLRIENMTWASGGASGLGGRFTVSLADVTDFSVDNIQFNGTSGDGVHVTGPARYGSITNIRGKTGDDMVVLNTRDTNTSYVTDTQGDVQDIDTRGIVGEDTHNAFKIYDIGPGSKRWRIERCPVDGITGTSVTKAVQFTGEPWMDAAVVRNVTMYAQQSPLIEVGNDGGGGGSFSAQFIGAVDIENVEYAASTAAPNGVVRVNKPRGPIRLRNLALTAALSGTQPAGTNYGLVITGDVGPTSGAAYGSSLDVHGVYAIAGRAAAMGTFHAVQLAGSGRFQAVNISDVHAAPTAAGTLLVVSSAMTFGALNLHDIAWTGTYLVQLPASNPATTMRLSNVQFTGTSLVSTGGPATVELANVDVNTSAAIVAAVGATATPVRVLAGVLAQAGAGATLSRDGIQALSANGQQVRADITLLTPQANDLIVNTNAAAPTGAGLSVYTGSAWKNLTA